MTPLHPPITQFTLEAVDRYLQEQVPLQVERHLQQVLPGWVKSCSSPSVPGSATPWPPEYSRQLDAQWAQHWTTSLEPRIQEVVSAALDQLLEPLLLQLTEALTPTLETLVRSVLARSAT